MHFEVAVWFEEFEALVDEALPVLVGADHHLRVDVVEFAGEGPVLFKVVDFKGEVWRNAKGALAIAGNTERAKCTCAVVLVPDRHRGLLFQDVRRLVW